LSDYHLIIFNIDLNQLNKLSSRFVGIIVAQIEP